MTANDAANDAANDEEKDEEIDAANDAANDEEIDAWSEVEFDAKGDALREMEGNDGVLFERRVPFPLRRRCHRFHPYLRRSLKPRHFFTRTASPTAPLTITT